MEIGYCDSTTDREELHLPEKVPGIDFACEDAGMLAILVACFGGMLANLQHLHLSCLSVEQNVKDSFVLFCLLAYF